MGLKSRIANRSKKLVQRLLGTAGYELTRVNQEPVAALTGTDLGTPEFQSAMARSRPYTMTSPVRLLCLWEAVQYVLRHNITGAIVECGVWRGGSMMLASEALLEAGDTTRRLWLFDTFEGMTEPTHNDKRFDGATAETLLRDAKREDEGSYWCVASLQEVRANLHSTHYPHENIVFVEGPVETTIPEHMPHEIAILRLDTDWYESTLHCLLHLMPLLSPGGILILDDYGYWKGAKQAIDEYISMTKAQLFLVPVDADARCAVTPITPK